MHGSAPRLCHKHSTFARRFALIGLLAGAVAACGRGSPASPSPSSGSTLNLSANLSYCADEVNRYRASVGRAPLTRSADLEAFAARAAQDDGLVHQPHHWFATTNGGGMATAENEILWWQGLRDPQCDPAGSAADVEGRTKRRTLRHHGRRVFPDWLRDFRERI